VKGPAGSEKVRAQPIGISAAPNMTGQARGRGKGWPAALTKRDGILCSPRPAAAPKQHASKILPIWITTR
jgi:hypothetical protein